MPKDVSGGWNWCCIFRTQYRVWVDVSVVSPQAPSYVGKDAVVYRENAKRSRWSEAASEAGIEFCPFVVDTFGKFGEGPKSALDAIAESALQSFPYR